MARVYNFSAGPAVLPEAVLVKAAAEMLDYKGSGMSVMEMSHRSKPYEAIIAKTEADLRELMKIPANYKVLFLQGGASFQFAMIPMNLMTGSKKIDLINTGTWSQKAKEEAVKFGTVNVLADSKDKKFNYIPEVDPSKFDKTADYFHICTNNTIEGTVFDKLPQTGDVPLVADMSSNILSTDIDVSKFGVIFAGAQKNVGPAGLTIVIIREDLLARAPATLPTMLNFRTHVENGSMFNTPPPYAIYIAGLVFEWMKENGGIAAMEKTNREKAAVLYSAIDNSKMFKAHVQDKKVRSLMNIPFVCGTEEQQTLFLAEAKKLGLTTLAGHRSVGGCRASIYNAMPLAGVQKLADCITAFDKANA